MTTCSIDGCDRPSRKRTWCEMHYSRFKTHGTPLAPGKVRLAAECSEPDCAGKPIAKGLCRNHYYKVHKAANPEKYELWKARARERRGSKPRPVKVDVPCSVEGCEKLAESKGMCGAHYQRTRRFGDPTFHPPAPARICVVDGCEAVPNARGMCSTHYYRWARYGDPNIARNRPRRSPSYAIPQDRPCATCGETFNDAGHRARKYCGRSCKPSGRPAGSVNKRTWVEKLGREDGWTCGICSDGIDPTLYWPNPMAGSVDHIVMVKHGGTDARDNLRLTHLRCNVSRSRH